jgi:hypothetical protein
MRAIAGATTAMFGSQPQGASPQIQQPEDYGYRNRNLPEQLINAITEVIKEAQLEDRWWRLQEVLRASLCRYYDLGIQHLWCDGFNWMQAVPGQSYINGDGEEDSFPDYIGDYNIFTAFAQILQAKISEPDIGIDFQPIRMDRSVDRQAADAANAIRTQADIDRDPHEVMTEKIYFLEMDGTAVTWAGTRDRPDDFGGEDGPRRATFREVGGVLEWKRPLFAQSVKEWWYAIHYRDTDIRIAKDKYDWIADELEGGQPCLAESSYERLHRLAMVQSAQRRGLGLGSGDSIEHLITEGDIWLRPCAFVNKKDAFRRNDGEYEEVPDGDGGTRAKTVREKLGELFPQGMHVVAVGQKYAEAIPDTMDKRISACHAYIGKGQTRYPLMYPIVLNQDGFNQTVNYIRENNDFGAPATWVNSQYCDYASISKQASRPGAFHELKNLPGGVSAANMIYREPQIAIPGGFLDFAAEFLMGSLAQFQLACPPSVWGAPQPGNDTAEGMRLAASQALGILGKLRTRVINSDAEDYVHICMAVSDDEKYPDKMTIPGNAKGRTKIISKGALTRGNFRAFPDKDSGFPESTASMRQQMERTMTMLAPTNLGMEIMDDPRNAAEYMDVNGVKLHVRAAMAWDKQSREIEELIENRPTLNDPQLVILLNTPGTGVQTMLDAIKKAILAAEQNQLQQAQALWSSPQNPAMIQHAAQALAAKAQNLPEPPVPPMPPGFGPQFDPLTIARSSVPVTDSDFHSDEAKACQYWLSDDECATELDVDDMGEDPPNVPGVLNVQLHRLEHLLKEPPPPQLPAPPTKGPQPAVGSPPKIEPLPAGA